ncbi:MAG: hypothetical protein Q9227_002457 [Pyrenula ochraceoflavens]
MSATMLCQKCEELRIELWHQDISREVRTYSNPAEAKSLKSSCDLCHIVCEILEEIDDPNGDTASYCKEKWGHLFVDVFERSPVRMFQVTVNGEHNLVLRIKVDVSNLPGYFQGSPCWVGDYAFGGICVPAVPGRNFERTLSREHMISLAKLWYESCAACHEECQKFGRDGLKPKRLVELGSDVEHPSARLITSQNFTGEYAALSYCWGQQSRPTLLKQHNLSSFSNYGLSIAQLPSTIRDACELCLALGIHYLWVDSLCILQDSERDWSEESAHMSSIYAGAELTIKAAAGADCHYGLFVERSWRSMSAAQLKCIDIHEIAHECFIRGPQNLPERDDPINKRGWTLQETLLSPKLLTFGNYEMSWECRSLYWNESGNMLRPIPGMSDIFPQPIRVRNIFESEKPFDDERPDLFGIWAQVIFDYSRRQFSDRHDKLPALSGLANWCSKYLSKQDVYLAGLWKSQLPASLLWLHDLSMHENATRPTEYRAPSWSWASFDCGSLVWYRLGGENTFARIIDCMTTYFGLDPYGKVLDGYIKISAPLKQGWLVRNRLTIERFDFWGNYYDEEPRDPDSAPRSKSSDPFETVLGYPWPDLYDETLLQPGNGRNKFEVRNAVKVHCLRISSGCGMLLQPRSASSHQAADIPGLEWRRIGLVRHDSELWPAWWEDAQEQQVTIR